MQNSSWIEDNSKFKGLKISVYEAKGLLVEPNITRMRSESDMTVCNIIAYSFVLVSRIPWNMAVPPDSTT